MKRLVSAYDRLIEGLVAAAALMAGAVCLLIVWDVIARNLGLTPPESTVALTEYSLLYMTLAVAPALVRRRGHIVIALVLERLPPLLRRLWERAICAFCATLSLIVAGLALWLAIEATLRGEADVRSFDIPRGWLFAPLTVGFLLMGSEFLRLCIRGEALARPLAERESL
ncbi:MAG: TRAP transporter small permease [Gammaproteobacteria bacterium]|nr:TRAP transporter small permease [Gammaproteobacteria bacterium]